MRYVLIAAASFAFGIMLSPHVALGQTAYPAKNIRVIVASPTGGLNSIPLNGPLSRPSSSVSAMTCELPARGPVVTAS